MHPPGQAQPRSCVRCAAPLGVSDQRCPFCGANQQAAAFAQTQAAPGGPAPVRPLSISPDGPGALPPAPKAVPFQPAVLGLTKHTEVSPSSRPLIIVQPRRDSGPLMIAAVGALALAAAGVGAWAALRRPPPPAPAPAASILPPLPPVVSSVAGVAVDDADRSEPADLLPRVKRTLASWDTDPQLIEMIVTGSRKGAVDLTRPGAQVTFRYAASKTPPRGPREGRLVELRAGAPDSASPIALAAEKPVPEPTCVWSAAWRSAVKSGIPEDAPVEGRYALSPKGDARWTITVPGQPALTREADGKSCALKGR